MVGSLSSSGVTGLVWQAEVIGLKEV